MRTRVKLIVVLALSALSTVALANQPAEGATPQSVPSCGVRLRRANRGRPIVRAARTTGTYARRPEPFGSPERAVSIGSPNDGRLHAGAHLDTSKAYLRVVPAYEAGDARWGLPQLVRMIDRAAHVVAQRFPGSVLDVGDLSKKDGGDLRRHHSHQSGRDADIGFFTTDPRGKQAHGPTFVKIGASMTSPTTPGASFDVQRTWALMRELLTDPVAHVSHLFIAGYLRQMLLAYARPRVTRTLYERAEVTLMQPHDSLPHDNHMHLRISCPRDAAPLCVELPQISHGMGFRRRAHHGASVPILHTPWATPKVRPALPVSAPAWLRSLDLPEVDTPVEIETAPEAGD